MADDVKPEVVKKTQDVLGKYIKKPPLTEKLLKKPPFRFLHDIITNVIRETGFLQGVFTPEELNHESIKDRDSKVAFLQKAIDAVKTITGIQLMVRPSKIVAGHEANRTNEFLQAIGKALDKKLSSKDYIAKLNKKDRILKDKGAKAKTTGKEETTNSKSKSVAQSKSHTRDKSKSKEPVKKKSSSSLAVTNDKQPKPTVQTTVEDSAKSLDGPPPEAAGLSSESAPEVGEEIIAEPPAQEVTEDPAPTRLPAEPTPPPPPPAEPQGTAEPPSTELQKQEKEREATENSPERPKEVPKTAALDRVSPKRSASHHEKKRKSAKVRTKTEDSEGENIRKETDTPTEVAVFGNKTSNSEVIAEVPALSRVPSARPRTARPASARPAAPRIRDRGEVAVQEEPKSVVGKVNVITDVDSLKEQDESENFVVVEAPSATSLEQQELALPLLAPGEEGQHGHLVAQIIETQKELEDEKQFAGAGPEALPKRVDIEWEAGQRREKEVASKEVDRLRTSIQTLTRAANPLGKLMDFLQEDVDAMQRELDSWKATNSQLKLELIQEQTLTEESVEPMKAHLQQLQLSILQKLDEISSLKATILRNDVKIQRLVAGDSILQTDKIV